MKMPNLISRDMAIHAAADLANALKTTETAYPFQVGDAQFKAIRKLANIFETETKIPNRDALPNPHDSIMKKGTKLPRVEDQTYPPTRGVPDKESNKREQNLTSTI